jgi:hypothetical protein
MIPCRSRGRRVEREDGQYSWPANRINHNEQTGIVRLTSETLITEPDEQALGN